MLPWRDRVVLLWWEDCTAAMGAGTLMGEGKGDGTVMGGLFFFPRALGMLSLRSILSPCAGFSCPLAVLETVRV